MKINKIVHTLCLFLSFNLSAQSEDKSKVIFFRTFNYLGGGNSYNVSKGNEILLRIKPRIFKEIELDSKPTRFWAKMNIESHIDIDLQPNTTYFIKCKAGMLSPIFKSITEDEFRSLYLKKKYLRKKVTEAGFTDINQFLAFNKTIKFQ